MNRLKNEITSPEFWKAAGIRALKTFCQTAIAAILSLLTSIATGLPEV